MARPATTRTVLDLPLAAEMTERPSLARMVLVKTPVRIGGQDEHAAIITRVISDDLINVMLMPGTGEPYSVANIQSAQSAPAGAISWRWPPRS